MRELNTNLDSGLDLLHIPLQREKYGSNIMSNKKKRGFFSILLDYLSDILIEFLLILTIIHTSISAFLERDYLDGLTIIIGILVMMIVSTFLGYHREK